MLVLNAMNKKLILCICRKFQQLLEKFTLINKDRSRIKVFEPFAYISKPEPTAEIKSYKDPEVEDNRDIIHAQDVLMLDRISI